MEDCIFCKIIKKESKADIIFEDESFLALKTIEPITKGHVLVIPKTHFKDIFDINSETVGPLMIFVKKIAMDIVKEYNATGINILHASGKDAQQSVFHFHVHVIPRYPDDGLDLWLKNRL
jgi:histidine triad (HIT) family protein